MKSGSLNLLEPTGPHRACYGTPLPLSLSVNCAGLSEFSLRNYSIWHVPVQQQIGSECLTVDFHVLRKLIIVINIYNI
jgi:hypothetical protein